jgi:hypothetical protein
LIAKNKPAPSIQTPYNPDILVAMSVLVRFQAIIDPPQIEAKFQYPWQISPVKPSFRLSGNMTEQEIGLVLVQLVQYNQVDFSGEISTILTRLIAADGLILPGGIQVLLSDGRDITSGCCCGLETWREWLIFLTTGDTPWLGHDPSPWLERQGELVRIWSNESGMNTFFVDVPQGVFQESLRLVEQDLQAFLWCVDSWAQDLGFDRAAELVHKIDRCFNIGRIPTIYQ